MRRPALVLFLVAAIAAGIVFLMDEDRQASDPVGPQAPASRGEEDVNADLVQADPVGDRREEEAAGEAEASAVEPDPAQPPPEPEAAPAVDASPLRLVALDEETGEAIPWLGLRVTPVMEDNASGEEVETDDQGRATSERAFAAGRLRVQLLAPKKGPGSPGSSMMNAVQVEHDPRSDEEHRLNLRIGPTYRLDLDLPAGLKAGDLLATLDSEVPGDDAWNPTARTAAVRATPGPMPWVRFDKPLFYEEPRAPWRLAVSSEDGSWSGAARVSSIAGIYPDPVAIELTARGWIEGTLNAVDADARDVYVELVSPGEAQPRTLGPFQESYRLGSLAPGAYRLWAFNRTHEHAWTDVEVRAGHGTPLDLVLDPRPHGGDLAGRIESATGERHSDLRVIAFSTSHKRRIWTQTPTWKPDQDHGTFRFKDLPADEYRLTINALGVPPVEPKERVVRPPDETLVFRIQDDAPPVADKNLRGVDAESGECIQGPEVIFRDVGSVEMGIRSWTSGCSIVVARHYLRQGTFEWVLRCEGYEAAWGDHTDFEPLDLTGDDTLSVPLQKGWSARFYVADPEGAPVAGVEISAEGLTPAATDNDGLAVLRAPARPAKVQLTFGDWQIASGDVLADGSFAVTGFDVRVVMAPGE